MDFVIVLFTKLKWTRMLRHEVGFADRGNEVVEGPFCDLASVKKHLHLFVLWYLLRVEGRLVRSSERGGTWRRFRYIILNLEKSWIVNSIGVSILIEVIERVKKNQGSVSFCVLTPTVAKTFRIMRLTEAAEIYKNEEESIGAVVSRTVR